MSVFQLLLVYDWDESWQLLLYFGVVCWLQWCPLALDLQTKTFRCPLQLPRSCNLVFWKEDDT